MWTSKLITKEPLGYFHSIWKSASWHWPKWPKAGGTITWHLVRCGCSYKPISSGRDQFKLWNNEETQRPNQQHNPHSAPAIICSWKMFFLTKLLLKCKHGAKHQETSLERCGVHFHFSPFAHGGRYISIWVIYIQLNDTSGMIRLLN